MLKELDPHSVFITKDEVKKMNEPLEGNFDGIGVSFQLLNDSIHVVEVISGGPAEKVGMLAGDIIIKVDNKPSTGDTIKNDWVFKNLRGEKGTKVKVSVKRATRKEPIVFNITRDKIPIHSIDTWFMLEDSIGYIRLNRFAQTSTDEFVEAVKDLKQQGMKDLIFDLRGNGGGYLNIAFEIGDHFLSGNKTIVYTQGLHSPRQDYNAQKKGVFEEGKLIILVDEYTASASEIVSGAVQDWKRGTIIGRQTFGKGLVQRPFTLEDKSQIRLTTSRYYTPKGRCIQKPYETYEKNSDTTGDWGIIPDIKVEADTSRASDYLINLRSKGLFNTFALNWVEKHRKDFLKKAPDFATFEKEYEKLGLLQEFEKYAKEEGVEKTQVKKQWVNQIVMNYLKQEIEDSTQVFNSYEDYAKDLSSKDKLVKEIIEKAKEEDTKMQEMNKKSETYIALTLKALIARNLYGVKYFYMCTKESDEELQKAIETIKSENTK